MNSEIGTVRGEISDLRGDMNSQIGTVRGEISDLRGDMNSETGTLRGEISRLETRLIRWVVGTGIAVGVLVGTAVTIGLSFV